jgi:demethylmenaquinone methyltransferase/2-methoxy-6-polyprenyl-1,4-benzoquinol methylase
VESFPKQPSRVGVDRLFDGIAPTYDLLNRLLSFRRDVAWRRCLVEALPKDDGLRLLDVATGTADVPITAVTRCPQLAHAVGVDFSGQMLAHGKRKVEARGLSDPIELHQGDALGLKFDDESFDAVTIAFGIRNVMNTEAALKEMWRVLKPGGSVLVLEFSLPRSRLLRATYLFFFRHILPRLGGLISGDAGAYRYLNETVETYPCGREFVAILERVGFSACSCRALTFGIASLYSGVKST